MILLIISLNFIFGQLNIFKELEDASKQSKPKFIEVVKEDVAPVNIFSKKPNCILNICILAYSNNFY